MPQKDEMLSLDDTAKKLGVSRQTIYKLIGEGKLRKFKRLGDKKTYLRVDEIEQAVEPEERE
jgi:excisionase family DNA binding protein